MSAVMDIVIEIVVILLAAGCAWLGVKVKGFIQSKVTQAEWEKLSEAITGFVKAAEQQFKDMDKTGKLRFNYVAELVQGLGYELTDDIKARIEAAVFDVNRLNGKY